MSLFDDISAARAEAVAREGEHVTRVPSYPPQVRAVWKPLEDPGALSVLLEQARGKEDADVGPKLAKLLAQSLVRLEATEDDPTDPAAEWHPVEDGEGPLRFDQRMERRLRDAGQTVEPGVYGVAYALCGGAAGILTLATDVGHWQILASKRIADATEGTFAARQQMPATAPRSGQPQPANTPARHGTSSDT